MIAGDLGLPREHLSRWHRRWSWYQQRGAAGPVPRVQLRSPNSYDRSIVNCDGVLIACSTAEPLAWNPATGE